MGFITALSATGLAAGLAFTGVSAGNAATSSITLPDGGVLEHRVTTFCNRVPDLLKRVDKASERISGDADTKGSLEWLKARQARAESNDHDRVAARIERRIERRTKRLAALPDRKQNLADAQDECATLDLPAPTGS